MCKFMSSLSKYSPSVGVVKRNPNLEMFLQPCKDNKTYYRVRLLGFASTVGRTDPHIVRYVHKAWVTDPKTGKKKLEKVVCTSKTPWAEPEGTKASSCKICNYTAQQWAIYNESGKTDTDARRNAGTYMANYEAIIPVYVKNDPNYERNNGKFKVIIMNNAKVYKDFRDKVQNKLREVQVLNGVKAVDTLIHVGYEEVTAKNGKTYKNPVIDKILFSTEPYDIPAINSKSIDAFPFDETYYTLSDPEDVDEFYNKHCVISNDDIPEDDEIVVYKDEARPSAPSTEVKMPTNDIPTDDISDDDIDNLISDEKDAPVHETNAPSAPASNDDIDSDDILADLGI